VSIGYDDMMTMKESRELRQSVFHRIVSVKLYAGREGHDVITSRAGAREYPTTPPLHLSPHISPVQVAIGEWKVKDTFHGVSGATPGMYDVGTLTEVPLGGATVIVRG